MPDARWGLGSGPLRISLFLLVWLALPLSVVRAQQQLDQAGDPLPQGAIARLGSVRLRHGDTINALTFTPDGRGLLAGANDGSLVLWDASTGKERLRLVERGPAINAVAVSPDGKLLLAADADGCTQVWDAVTGQRRDSWRLGRSLAHRTLLFLPDSRNLLMLGYGWQCRDVTTGRLLDLVPDAVDDVNCAAVAPDGKTLAIQSRDFLRLYGLPLGKPRALLEISREERAVQLAFTPDSKELLCLSGDGQVQVRDPETGKVVKVHKGKDVCPLLVVQPGDSRLTLNPHWRPGRFDARPLVLYEDGENVGQKRLKSATAVALSVDGRTLAVAHYDRQIRLWDLEQRTQRFPATPLRGRFRWQSPTVRVSPDGRHLGSLDWDGSLTVGETATGRSLWKSPDGEVVTHFVFTPDGKQVSVVEDRDWLETLTFRDVLSGKVQGTLPATPDSIAFLALSADGRWLASGVSVRPDSRRTQVYLWDRIRKRCIYLTSQATGWASAAAFSPDSRRLITAGRDGQLRLWDVATGRELQSWLAHGGHLVDAVAFSQDGRLVVSTGADKMIRLWQSGNWKCLRCIDDPDHDVDPDHDSSQLALSPDGRLVLTTTRYRVAILRDTETGQVRWTGQGDLGGIEDVCFTLGGRRLVTVGADGRALIWDLNKLPPSRAAAPIPRLDAQEQPLPAGALARVGSVDRQAGEPWGRVFRRLKPEERGAPSAFSPDGKIVATASWNTVHCFNTETGDCLSRIATERMRVQALAFSPDGRLLALGGKSFNDGPAAILLWDLHEEKLAGRLTGHEQPVEALAFSADARLLHASCQVVSKPTGLPYCRHVWDVRECKHRAQFPIAPDRHEPGFFAFSPRGRFLIQGPKEKGFEIRDPVSNRKLLTQAGTFTSAVFSRDEKVLALTDQAGEIQLWDPIKGQRLRTLGDPRVPEPQLLAIADDGRWLVTRSRGHDGLSLLQVWDGETGKLLRPQSGPIGAVRDLVWMPDGKLWLLEQGGSLARLADQEGKERLCLQGRSSAIEALGLSPDGRLAAFLDRAGKVELWDLTAGQSRPLAPFPGLQTREERGGMVRFLPNGLLLALNGAGQLRAWSVTTGKPVPCWQAGKSESGCALSPDGRVLAVFGKIEGQFQQVRLICPLTGKEQARSSPVCRHVFSEGFFSPDGRLLAMIEPGSAGPQISLLEAATGQIIATLAFPDGVGPLAFSPDNRYLVGQTEMAPWKQEGEGLLVHDLALGRELGVLPCHAGKVLALSFSPDGRKLATGSADQTALIWDATWPTLPRPALSEARPVDAETLWRELVCPEAEPAWRAVWRLAHAPEQSLPLIQRRLKPAQAPDREKLARLLPELEQDAFARRETARKEILSLGEGVLPALRKRLQEKPSADLKRLLEGLLEDLEPRPNAPGQLLDSRAIAVLERIGSGDARQLLQHLANGAEGHSRTEMAREALRRLERRASP